MNEIYCWCGHEAASHEDGWCLGCADDPDAMEPGGNPMHEYREAR